MSFETVLLAEAAAVLNSLFAGSTNYSKWHERNPFVEMQLVRYFNFQQKHAKRAVDTFLSSSEMGEAGVGKRTVSIKVGERGNGARRFI
jgi:hypothetical protein